MKVEKKYPEFNPITITIESQEEVDTIRTALENLRTYYLGKMVVLAGISTTPKRMSELSADFRRNLDNPEEKE